MLKRIAIVMAALAVIVGCGSAEPSVSPEASGNDQMGTTSSVPNTFPVPNVDEVDPRWEFPENFTTGPFEHACGTFSVEQEGREVTLRQFGEDGWRFVSGFSVQFDSPVIIAEHQVVDVTGDGQPEIVMSWQKFMASHTWGSVFVATQPECEWKAAMVVDPCGSSEWVPDLVFTDDGKLIQKDFGGCGKIVPDDSQSQWPDSSRLEWNDEFGVFLYEPLSGSTMCEDSPDYDELPISTCRAGWVVEMVQAAIKRAGIRVDDEGLFDRSTRLAVLSYQRLKGLELTGEVDTATWAVMYPVGGPDGTNLAEFPDFDGDGVSSPREIGHASGALE